MTRPRILIADDHQLLLEGLRRLLADEFDVVATVQDGAALIEAVRAHDPHAVVADISMPKLNGIDAALQIRLHHPKVKVIILSMHSEAGYVQRALSAGVSAFV